jgi:hypothetical protein
MKLCWLAAIACGLAAAACGGGSSTPDGPSVPSVPTYSVAVTVFYDQDADGQLDANEAARVPGVEVVIGTGSGTSAPGTGVASVTGIQEGVSSIAVRTESLPAYYQAPPSAPIQVPGATEARIGLTLPIGDNQPNLYLGLGDSITDGDGSSDGLGYKLKLQNLLGPHFGRAEVQTRGRQGDTSAETAQVTRRTLREHDPAYTLTSKRRRLHDGRTFRHQGPRPEETSPRRPQRELRITSAPRQRTRTTPSYQTGAGLVWKAITAPARPPRRPRAGFAFRP